jgi:hypothetical protein
MRQIYNFFIRHVNLPAQKKLPPAGFFNEFSKQKDVNKELYILLQGSATPKVQYGESDRALRDNRTSGRG